METFFVVLFFIVLSGIFYWISVVNDHKRAQALKQFAAANRWTFLPDEKYDMKYFFPKVALFCKGNTQETSNVIKGTYSGCSVTMCDYEYTTHTGKSTHTHYYSCYMLHLPVSFGWLNVAPEGLFSKIAQAFGYDDIDFESAEFSRRYCVRAQDRKEAYALITPQMIDYLMATPGLYFSIQGKRLLVTTEGKLQSWEIQQQLNFLLGIAARIPGYLLTQTPNA
jgi:hypothetical protein